MAINKKSGTFVPTADEISTILAQTVGNSTPNELDVIQGQLSRKVPNPTGAAIGSEPSVGTILG